LIGKLIYLTVTRPDITFAVGVLSRFIHQPIKVLWTAALRTLAYIKSSPGKDLLYKKHEHVYIFCYSDSGYAGNKGDKKSTTVYCTFVEDGARNKMFLDPVQRLTIEPWHILLVK